MSEEACGTDVLYLRDVTPADAEHISRWKGDPLVRRMALGPDHESTVEGEAADITRAVASEDEAYFVIVLREDDQPIGYVRIDWMDRPGHMAWLRFALGERRGEGHAQAALRCLLARLFAAGLHRVTAEAYEFNAASLKVMAKLGFRTEGRRRQAHFDGEAYHDVIALGLLRPDFGHDVPDPDSRIDPAS